MFPEVFLLSVFVFGFFVVYSVGLSNLYNPSVMFFYAHFLMFGIGGFYRSFYQDVVPVSDSVIYLVSFGLFAYLLGLALSELIVRLRSNSAKVFCPPVEPMAGSKSPLMITLMFFLPVFFFLVFTMKIGGFLWLMEGMDDLRIDLRRGLGPIVLLGIASCFVCSILFIHALRPRFVFALIVIVIFSVIAGSYGNRAPGGFVFLSSFYYYYTVIKKSPPRWLIMVGFFAFFVLLMALNIVRQGLEFTWYMVFVQVLWRPFVNFQNLDLIYQGIVKHGELQYGYGFLRDFLVIVPGYSGNNAEWIKEVLGLEFSGGGVTITYIGDLIINFSYFPVFIFSFVLGFFFNVFYYMMSVFRVSHCVMLIFSFSSIAVVSSGFVPPIINMLVPFLLVYFLFVFLRLFFKSISNINGI